MNKMAWLPANCGCQLFCPRNEESDQDTDWHALVSSLYWSVVPTAIIGGVTLFLRIHFHTA